MTTKERIDVKQNFVTFYSPGSFVAEDTTQPIDAWDIDEALRRLTKIKERYGATPYGFRFTTRGRGANELDSRQIAQSGTYYFGVRVRTLQEVEEANLPDEQILRSNMRGNGYDKVVTTTSGWRWTQPLAAGDTVLHEADMTRALKGARPDKVDGAKE